jgi:glycosyltransferase involved in cell wall biosynthesis
LSQIISEPDKGIYNAMNKGLAIATGDIICFLNADDWYASPKTLSLVISDMEANRLDALIGDVAFVKRKNPTKIIRRYRSDQFKPEKLGCGWMPAHPALFLRKEVVKRVGEFDESYRIAGDFEFIIRIFHNQTVNYKHSKEVMVLMHTGGVSNAGWRTKVKLNKEVLRACRENGVRSNVFMLLSKYPRKLMEFF